MEIKIEIKMAESQEKDIVQIEQIVDNAQTENKAEQKSRVNSNKKPLTPYQKYKQSKNQNGKKYFEFYNDVKVYTHNIWDW
jgi:hypothetical protein